MSKKQDKVDNGIVAVKSKVGVHAVTPSIVDNNDTEDVGEITHYLNCFAVRRRHHQILHES